MINCEICNQDFKSELGLEKHNITNKHATNFEIKVLKDDKISLQNENIELHENILILSNEIENFKIEAVQNLLEINEMKKLNNKKCCTIESLVSKVKILEDKQSYFNIFAIGGISFSIIIYLVKDNHIINLY